jgi:hypothetical protein
MREKPIWPNTVFNFTMLQLKRKYFFKNCVSLNNKLRQQSVFEATHYLTDIFRDNVPLSVALSDKKTNCKAEKEKNFFYNAGISIGLYED